GRGRNLGESRRRRREPAGRDAAARPLSAAERRDRNSRPGNRRRSGAGRPWGHALEQGRQGDGARGRRRLRRILPRFCKPCPAVPVSLSMIEAAAIPETFFTVRHNVFERGKLTASETLLVHGASSRTAPTLFNPPIP